MIHLFVVRNLFLQGEDLSKLGCLAFNFLSSIDISLVSFTHVHRKENCLVYLLAKDALVSDSIQNGLAVSLPM